ncbi:PREDICTED: U-box domain-containing protein 62-like [Nelumbo nucifera]|uniref:U-box domain-containing protein 62-like n=2 Tax=Nelumbo nucifera TaxID=4432 RepID=A0A1U7ZH16_NELNU|nr:PREDICTED: U-box domain-containing protein 62-like [Nelumbo nucifera]
MDNGLNSQMVFQDDGLQFSCGAPQRHVADPGRKTREVSGFADEKMFPIVRDRYVRTPASEFRRSLYDSSPGRQDRPENQQNWNGNGSARPPSADGSEGEEDDDEEEDDEVDEGDREVEALDRLVAADDGNNKNNNSSSSVHSSSEKIRNEKSNLQKHPSFGGSSRGALEKDVNVVQSATSIRGSPSEQQHQQGRITHYDNAVTIAEPDIYYSQFLQGTEGTTLVQKEMGGDNGCGFSGRRDGSLSNESGESLRAILSDPLTGTLMDDAMILPCGHSFGSGGMQHVFRMKACCICSQSVSEDSVAPNLTLRAAVQAFRREEELQSFRASKRRRERFEQDKYGYGDTFPMDMSRGRGVQFPFSVSDRVIIRGNKRTPQRFIGREAVITTQCLNGWYVVKTLDNAESVKLQYRSLAKVSDNPLSNLMSVPVEARSRLVIFKKFECMLRTRLVMFTKLKNSDEGLLMVMEA